uniref:Uncharacterized protein n=1 Tax=Oryza meridionalis TaxID=40149 RepID=A0A0E0CJ73_9ORYZ
MEAVRCSVEDSTKVAVVAGCMMEVEGSTKVVVWWVEGLMEVVRCSVEDLMKVAVVAGYTMELLSGDLMEVVMWWVEGSTEVVAGCMMELPSGD